MTDDYYYNELAHELARSETEVDRLREQLAEQSLELAETQGAKDAALKIVDNYRTDRRKWFEVAKDRARDYKREQARVRELEDENAQSRERVKELEAKIEKVYYDAWHAGHAVGMEEDPDRSVPQYAHPPQQRKKAWVEYMEDSDV